MSFTVKEEAIWAAIESSYNTEQSIVATDVLEVENLQADPAHSAKIIERNIIRNSLAPQVHQYGGSLFGFSFDMELKGSGTAGTAPRVGRILRACGVGETIVASTSVTYQPESDISLHDSLTMFYREGPNVRRVTGVRGDASLSVDAGGRFMLSFTMIGHKASVAAEAAPSETPETTQPPIFVGANFTADAYATAIGKFAMALGNTMSIAPSPNSSDSFGEIRVGARKVAGSFDPEAQSIATKDYIDEFEQATEFALATGTIGSAGNQLAISLPRCQFTGVAPGEREGLRVFELPFAAYPTSSGDDDFAIQLT